MTVSRLASSERYKGHDRVIRILPRVLAQHPDTIYLIVGDGDDRPRLEALAAEVRGGGKGSVRGLGGRRKNCPIISGLRMCSSCRVPARVSASSSSRRWLLAFA